MRRKPYFVLSYAPRMAKAGNLLEALRKKLEAGNAGTQEELREALEKDGYDVVQSTVSRLLRKLSAVRAVEANGRIVYRLSESSQTPLITTSLSNLVLDIASNGAMIVIHTPPGSASLVARHLDRVKPKGVLGTLAGDDTIFVAPTSVAQIKTTLKELTESLQLET